MYSVSHMTHCPWVCVPMYAICNHGNHFLMLTYIAHATHTVWLVDEQQ